MGRGRVHLPLHHRHGRTTRARHRRLPIQSRTYNGTGRRTARRGCVRLPLHHRHGRTTRARHRRLPIQSRTYNGTGRR
ncbi:hypothetical protein, partial [Streptomyces sp. NPDC085659]